MTKEDLAKMIEAQFSAEDLAAIEAMSEAERAEFMEFFTKEVKGRIEKTQKKSDELVALAKKEGANVDGSKGMQFLIGAVAGLSVVNEELGERIAKLEKHLQSKMMAARFLKDLRGRAAKKET